MPQIWDIDAARKIHNEHGKLDFITFTNVFAHISQLGGVLDALKIVCGPKTVLVVENHYLGSVLDSMNKKEEAIEQFKQIYEADIGYRDVAAKVDAYYAGQ